MTNNKRNTEGGERGEKGERKGIRTAAKEGNKKVEVTGRYAYRGTDRQVDIDEDRYRKVN